MHHVMRMSLASAEQAARAEAERIAEQQRQATLAAAASVERERIRQHEYEQQRQAAMRAEQQRMEQEQGEGGERMYSLHMACSMQLVRMMFCMTACADRHIIHMCVCCSCTSRT